MSFPEYPDYKGSGVDWLDEIPEHWKVIAAKRGISVLTDFTANGSFASLAENVEYQSSGYARLIRMTDLRQNLETEGVWVDENAYRYLEKSSLTGGELLMASVGSVGLIYLMPEVDYPASLAPNMYLLKTNTSLLSKFFYWSLLSEGGQSQILQVATTTAQPKLNKDNVRSIVLALPTVQEQTKIVRFLDHETARIDALIVEQQGLIGLLKEKRQAAISHAVTNGLDTTVPMKDSGVEWVGEVPAHWNVGTLRWYATIQGGVAKGKDYEGRETVLMPYLRVANVQNGFVDLSEVKEISVLESEVERYSLRAGDVLMNEGGDNDKLGRGTVWQGQITPCLHQNHVFAIRPNNSLTAEWLATLTQSEQARFYFFLNSKQSTNLASISASNVMSLALPLPPVSEQQQILSYLDQHRAWHEQLVEVATSTVELLKERRSALISAAVTGKIDVRSWLPPASAPTQELEREAV
ncbi:restriction endonuclease subunit S [Pseudomonas versuta]|uniref:Restriction endonuclease subunit S n=1 Tax=Pseudomonas versuta TaxID=1788301 RepID=A0ABX3E8L7_9PSED|nr:restriction endonuclease subunit S [Pseudomonas versuta]ALE88760.1 restriction endonuclease subunit S [Pseudomonas versuta]OKA21780.1 restriction endonuclease subunit S [Pseudomonas versuta]